LKYLTDTEKNSIIKNIIEELGKLKIKNEKKKGGSKRTRLSIIDAPNIETMEGINFQFCNILKEKIDRNTINIEKIKI